MFRAPSRPLPAAAGQSIAAAILVLLVTALTGAALAAETPAAETPPAATANATAATMPLLDGMGPLHRDIGSANTEAQRYFDQGLTLAFGFNHGAAERSFREAVRLDPNCAMCHWGIALVLGPHINAAMDPAAAAPAFAAITRAEELAVGARPADRALIAALAARYAADPNADRAALDLAWAEAMRRVAMAYGGDADVLTLTAEALMDLHPWDLWEETGEPKPWTGEILDLLEHALRLDPDHPGANHFYIHAYEASRTPERALAQADRLRDLVPGAGHLVHMPGHIYMRTGRYWDVIEANVRAVAADRKSLAAASCHDSTLYALAYVPHNAHFLWAAATFAGAGELATATARDIAAQVDPQAMRQPGLGTLQHYSVTPLYSAVRFGRFAEILATPEPAVDLLYPRGVWNWARGIAHLRAASLFTGAERAAAFDRAVDHLDALARLAVDPGLEVVTIWDINGTNDLLAIAHDHLAGELAAARGNHRAAFHYLRAAVAREDALRYDEPPPWALPIRQSLGAIQLAAGDPAAAEVTFRADLERFRDNGWSLHGLAAALAALGREEEAKVVRERFEKAFARADVSLAASRF